MALANSAFYASWYTSNMKADRSLHRIGKKSDWAKVSPRTWNIWQQLANTTGGTLTLGNIFTLAGLSLVIVGLAMIVAEMYGWGLALVAAGRLCDLADGWLADQTHTKSPLGEALDSGADKLATAATLGVLVMVEAMPGWLALAILATQLAIVALFFVYRLRGRRLHPSRIGKLSMAAVWLGLGGFIVALALSGTAADVAQITGYAAADSACLLALAALAGYWRKLYAK